MTAADPLQEVADLKRKLRLIKNKLLNPTERNLRQAISMIDDTFATEEIQMNCSRYGITCTPPAMFVMPGYTPSFPDSPVAVQPATTNSPTRTPTMIDANIQTEKPPKLITNSTQTTETGEICSFSQSALYNTTQTNLQNAIDLLTETKNSLTDRGKKRRHDGGSQRSTASSSTLNAVCTTQFSKALATPKGRGVTHLQRVHKQSESTAVPPHMLMSSEKLAIGDGFSGKYTPVRDKNFDPVSADKRKKIKDIEFACKYCCFRGDSEQSLFYHDCTILPQLESPFLCCGTSYKHRGYYIRHRDMKHKKQ